MRHSAPACASKRWPRRQAFAGSGLASSASAGSGSGSGSAAGCGSGAEARSRGRTVGYTLLYALGLALVYASLGLLAGLTGTLFGTVSSNRWAYLVMANLLLLFALAMRFAAILPDASIAKTNSVPCLCFKSL